MTWVRCLVDPSVPTLRVAADATSAAVPGAIEASNQTALLEALPSADGLVFLGHGRRDALLDRDHQVVLGGEHLGSLVGKWVWALACASGEELAGRACAEGCRVYAGYDTRLIVEWDGTVPAELDEAVRGLLTEVPRALATGADDDDGLRSRILQWRNMILDRAEELPYGLDILAQQLLSRLVVRRASPIEVLTRLAP